MSDKVEQFYQLISSMTHGELRQISKHITELMAARVNSGAFQFDDYRDFSDLLFDCTERDGDAEAYDYRGNGASDYPDVPPHRLNTPPNPPPAFMQPSRDEPQDLEEPVDMLEDEPDEEDQRGGFLRGRRKEENKQSDTFQYGRLRESFMRDSDGRGGKSSNSGKTGWDLGSGTK